jgi:hypothetical protein
LFDQAIVYSECAFTLAGVRGIGNPLNEEGADGTELVEAQFVVRDEKRLQQSCLGREDE